MLSLMVIAMAGAASAAGATAVVKWRKPPSRACFMEPSAPKMTVGTASTAVVPEGHAPPDPSAPPSSPLGRLKFSLAEMDERYHAFIYRHVDTRLHRDRQNQWQSINQTELKFEITPEAKAENWRLARTSGIALTASLAVLYPPWLLLTIPLAIYETYSNVEYAYTRFLATRRLGLDQLMPFFVGGLWVTGSFITGAVSMWIYALAMKMTYLAQDRTRARLVNVLGEQPRRVWILIDGGELEISFDQLEHGATLVVQAGQIIPIDGTILSGTATLDQQSLTGEAQPLEKGPGDEALAGTLILSGQLHIRVEKTGAETLAAQIGTILERTMSHHLVVEQRAKRMADAWVLPSLVTTTAALVTMGLKSGVAVLCNMPGVDMAVLGPLTLMNFLNLASRSHVLIKDGRSLELLHKVDTIIFDKTGTLTFGSLDVCAIHLSAEEQTDQVLAYAAAAEQRQSHPIAHAILAAAMARGLALPKIRDTQIQLGYGLRVWLNVDAPEGSDDAGANEAPSADSQLIRVGSERFMALEGLNIPPDLSALQATCHDLGHTLVLVARNAQVVGALELEPTVRPEAATVIAALKQRNLTTMIISGDQEAPTRKLAEALQIDRYYANVLPPQKASLVADLQAAGRSVCFVGDGINDAIALKQAHVSISLRGATTVATDTAQIVMMNQSLGSLPALIDLSHELNRNLMTSLGISTIPSLIVVGGVFLFHFGLPISLATFTGSFVLSVANAMVPTLRERMVEAR